MNKNTNKKKNNRKSKQKLSFKKIFKYLLLFIILSFVFYNNIYQFSLNRSVFKKNIFNIKLYHVTENTMGEIITKGDISVISTRKRKYNIGDIIFIQDQSGLKLERLMDILENDIEDTEDRYITKADESYYFNNFTIEEDMIIGKQIFKIPKIGWLLEVARSEITTFIMIVILIIVLFFLLQIRLYKPSRSTEIKQDDSWFTIIKLMFNKENRKLSKRRDRHSRKVQKEKTKRRLKARRKKRDKEN